MKDFDYLLGCPKSVYQGHINNKKGNVFIESSSEIRQVHKILSLDFCVNGDLNVPWERGK